MVVEKVLKRRPLQSLSLTSTVADAARTMQQWEIGFLPVCDDTGRAIGVVTDRDLVVRALAEGLAPSTAIAEVMTREVIACRPHEDLFRAQQLMREHHKCRVLCVDERGEPVGVVSLSDVAEHEDGLRLSKTVRAALKGH